MTGTSARAASPSGSRHGLSGGGGVEGDEPHLTAAAVARVVGGALAEEDRARAEQVAVRRVAPLDRAAPDEVSFLADGRYAALFARTRAGVVLVAPALAASVGAPEAVRVVVERPHEALLRLLPLLHPAAPRIASIHPTAVLGRGVSLGAEVTVGAYAVLGDGATLGDRAWVDAHCVVGDGVAIGDDSRLHAHVTLYPGTRLGRRVIVHAGTRLGSDGFGYVFGDGAHQKIPHVGRCLVDDDVEIGANVTVDRGSIDDTVIGAGTKIDNLVQVGHNVRIGRLCLLMAQVGIAGSAEIGDGVVIAGQAGLGGHIVVGDRARIGGQAGVFGDVPPGETWSGYPARPHRESLRTSAALHRLARVVRPLERLAAGEMRGAGGGADGGV